MNYNNNFFSEKNLTQLVLELSSKYNINDNEVTECINRALSKSYNYERVVFNKDGSITGMKKTREKNDIVHHNISKKIYKKFQNNIHNEFFNSSFVKIEKHLSSLIIESQNIFYGRIIECNTKDFTLALYDKNSNQLKNFFATIGKKSNFIFKNELYNKKYSEIDNGMLIYIPKREKINNQNGRFFIKAIRKHEIIIRYKINSIFKDIKESLGKSYSYKRCFIDLKRKKITLITNIMFSDVVKKYISDELLKIDEFELIFIKD